MNTVFDGVSLANDVSIDELVKLTDGYSGAEIYHHKGGGVCNKAAQLAARRHVKLRSCGDPPEYQTLEITWDDCREALEDVKPVSRMDPDIIKRNLEWGKSDHGNDPDDEDCD